MRKPSRKSYQSGLYYRSLFSLQRQTLPVHPRIYSPEIGISSVCGGRLSLCSRELIRRELIHSELVFIQSAEADLASVAAKLFARNWYFFSLRRQT